jgi:glucose-1-phosphate adenylyltransferase
VSADAVYALDYEEVVRGHLASDAHVTMVTTHVEPDDASRYGVVLVDDGRVTDYAYKPDEPKSDLVTNEVFVFTRARCSTCSTSWAGLGRGRAGRPRRRAAAPARRVGTGPRAPLRRLLARPRHRPGVLAGAHGPAAGRAALRPGAQGLAAHDARRQPAARPHPGRRDGRGLAAVAVQRRRGTVCRSVLSPHAVVEAGAEVYESVLLHGAIVRSGAVVRRAILDQGAEVGAGVTVGGDGEIALVGRDERVEADLPAGGRQPESEQE